LPSQGSRITIEPGEGKGGATDHSLVGLGVRPMRIPGADEAIEHLARWAGRGRWKEECIRAIAAHFEPVCAKSGISEDEFAEALGEFHYEMVEACAFEDFCSRRPASRRSNVIDDYLDQRGWKESIQARDYLRALRASVVSLYEVVEVKPNRGLVLRDLVRGGEPVEVDDQLGSQSAEVGIGSPREFSASAVATTSPARSLTSSRNRPRRCCVSSA
jgi:hypothetical protein